MAELAALCRRLAGHVRRLRSLHAFITERCQPLESVRVRDGEVQHTRAPGRRRGPAATQNPLGEAVAEFHRIIESQFGLVRSAYVNARSLDRYDDKLRRHVMEMQARMGVAPAKNSTAPASGSQDALQEATDILWAAGDKAEDVLNYNFTLATDRQLVGSLEELRSSYERVRDALRQSLTDSRLCELDPVVQRLEH